MNLKQENSLCGRQQVNTVRPRIKRINLERKQKYWKKIFFSASASAPLSSPKFQVIAVAPATFILNRPGWYKEKVLASGFPVLAVGSVFVVIAMTTQICERINERMVPLNVSVVVFLFFICFSRLHLTQDNLLFRSENGAACSSDRKTCIILILGELCMHILECMHIHRRVYCQIGKFIYCTTIRSTAVT